MKTNKSWKQHQKKLELVEELKEASLEDIAFQKMNQTQGWLPSTLIRTTQGN